MSNMDAEGVGNTVTRLTVQDGQVGTTGIRTAEFDAMGIYLEIDRSAALIEA